MDYIGQLTTHVYTMSGDLDQPATWGDAGGPTGIDNGAAPYSDGRMVVVIDYITLLLDCGISAARGSATLTLTAGGYDFWHGGLSVEAGDVDTLHVTFPSGLPAVSKSSVSGEHALPYWYITSTLVGTGYLSIGYHYELPSTRR